jgi:hypothetical protein
MTDFTKFRRWGAGEALICIFFFTSGGILFIILAK